jgi:hypothetical protein
MTLTEAATTLFNHCKVTNQEPGQFEMKTKGADNFFGIPVVENKRLPKNKISLKSKSGNGIGAFRFDETQS